MEGSCPLPGTTGSAARRRLKILACLFLGISVLSAIGTGGYFAYKKIQDTISDYAELTSTTTQAITIQQTIQTSLEVTPTPDVAPRESSESHSHTKSTLITFTKQTNMPTVTKSSTAITMAPTSSITMMISPTGEISNSPIVTTITPSDQTSSDMKSSSGSTKPTYMFPEQTTMPDTATASTPPLCSTRATSASHLNFSGFNSDPCLGGSSALCNNASENSTTSNYCECFADGVWTVIQKRFDGSVDFYRNWTDYKDGFGNLNGEYWLGNNVMHQMTSNANYTLKIFVTDWDCVTKYAVYDTFKIANETDGYRLTIGGYSGDAEDAMIDHHNGQMFSTKDRENDNSIMHCAEKRYGAWWYGNCGNANLNGRYYSDNTKHADGVNWLDWNQKNGGIGHSLKETIMMIRVVP